MDANKLTVLRDLNYTIKPSCETCAHSDLSKDGWGYCNVHTYQHLKHSEEVSRLSIHRSGSCARWELDENKLAMLGLHAFREFVANKD